MIPANAQQEPRDFAMLVVEDDARVRRAMLRTFERAGYKIAAASDAKSARELLETREFDIVLSDLAMPGETGIDLLRWIRSRHSEVPVILLTGCPDVTTAASAVEFSATRYLTKPVLSGQLLGFVAEAIQNGRAARHVHAEAETALAEQAALSARFDKALETLGIAYQPIVQWPEKVVLAREALVRPVEPGLNNPGTLFGAAERLGRVIDLGRVIRRRVAETIVHETFDVFVNVHPLELKDEELYSPDGPLSPLAHRIVLEITERAALDDIPDLERCIQRLRALGYRIALDDLGAGYAGLTSVAQLEPEVVKLDMSLVRNVHLHATQQRLIRSMVDLFRELNRVVVVEGVETMEEALCLQALGCDVFQGFLFGRPNADMREPSWPVAKAA